MLQTTRFKFLLAPLLAICCGIAIIKLQAPEIDEINNYRTIADYQQEDFNEQITAKILTKMPTFGFDNLIANWAFIKFLIYFGDGEVREKSSYAAIPDYFETVVNKDPRFISSYFYISPANSLFAGRPDLTVSLIEKGLESITPETSSKSYFLWMYKAVDELLFLGDSHAARESYLKAAEWAEYYDDERGQIVRGRANQTAKFLENNPDSKQAQIGAWTMLLSNASNDETRKIAVNNIHRLGGKIEISPNGQVRVRVPEESRV